MGNPFLATIDVLRERGWQQDSYGKTDEGPVCLATAMGFAAACEAAEKHFLSVVSKPLGVRLVCIEEFNDLVAESVEDVILALKHAALSWEDRPFNVDEHAPEDKWADR